MRLFSRFILRHLASERLRAATTVVGVALGIAVIIAIQLTNGSALQGFEAAVRSLAGRASVAIVGQGGPFDEEHVRSLGWLSEFGSPSPVVTGDLVVVGAQQRTVVHVLGVDMLRDRAIRDYEVEGRPDGRPRRSAQEYLELLLDPHAILLTRRFADTIGATVGASIDVAVDDRRESLTVRGLLEAEGPAVAFDGRVGVMDVAAAQWLFGQLGRLHRIDVRLDERVSADEAVEAMARRLPDGLTVRRTETEGLQAEQMLEAFQLNLTALSYIALLVGVFLVYNTIAVSVMTRRQEIGTLRALGLSRSGVLRLFLGEAVGLAIVGCTIGLGLGRLMANAAVELTSTAVRVLYIATAAAPPALELWHVVLAYGIGVPLALVAAVVPAVEAAATPPMAAIRDVEGRGGGSSPPRRSALVAIAFFAAAAGLATRPAVGNLPLWGYASALATVLGAAFLVPTVLATLTALVRLAVRRVFTLELWLANQSLAGSIRRLSISVAALAVSLSLTVAIVVMVESFRSTVVYWVAQTLQADLFIGAEGRSAGADGRVSRDVEELVRSHPDVAAVDRFRRIDADYGGRRIGIGSGDLRVLFEHGNLLFKAPQMGRAALLDAIERGHVIISESFAVRFGRHVGESIELPTSRGIAAFTVAAVYYDYSTDRGLAILDRGTFDRYFGAGDAQSLAVYLRDGADPETVRTSLRGRLPDDRAVFIRTNAGLRAQVLRIFDSTFAITYALEFVAVGVAVLGIVGTLIALIIDRRRELVVLRLLGASRWTVRRMVVVEAALIGVGSQAIGVGVGLALSLVLIYVINLQSFGWSLQLDVPVVFLAQMSAAIVAATALAGFYPAHRASGTALVASENPE